MEAQPTHDWLVSLITEGNPRKGSRCRWGKVSPTAFATMVYAILPFGKRKYLFFFLNRDQSAWIFIKICMGHLSARHFGT